MGEAVLCMFFLLVLLVPLSCEAINTTSDDSGLSMQNHEVHKHLKRLNKPAVKSIKSVDGDIIDCVNILHQPAFDHPDLKNHKIQMRPSFYPNGINMSSNSKPLTQLWQKSGSCPEGTIPIRRTQKDEIIRAKSIKKFGKKEQGSFPQPKSEHPPPSFFNSNMTHEVTNLDVLHLTPLHLPYALNHFVVGVNGDKFYGAKAGINVWNPQIENYGEFSLSQIWVAAGSSKTKDTNTIEAGWMVYPKLFGNNDTRLFTYWTRDAYTSTGCYNLACPGFVQISKDIVVGARLIPVSEYGFNQYYINLTIWKDPKTENWWLAYDNHDVGYWPSSLFTYLRDGGASRISWGGEILNSKSGGHHTSTQMGSGHFPYEGFRKASYFKNIKFVDAYNQLRVPTYLLIVKKRNCYGIKTGISKSFGRYFYYGGPGRNPKCP